MNSRPDEFTPYWLQTAMPSASNGGTLESTPPDPSFMFPWEYPWPHTSPMESRLQSPLDMWAQSTQAAPSAALPPMFAPAPEHLDSGKYWPVAPAPSGANEQPPSHGFYFSPVLQAPSWDQVPADASMTGFGQGLLGQGLLGQGLGQLFPQPPGGASWLASAPGASYSPADEALMADDARRVAADRLRRATQRTIPTAPPPEHLSPSNPLVHGFYLSPVGQGPSWEQVVPTATPWSVAPKLPSPTAWGDTLSGPECHTSGGKLTCITPGGRQVTVPAEGLDDELKIAPGHPNYHYYNTTARSYPGDPRSHMAGIIDKPTPGPSFLVRPATPEGTRNEAAPWYVHLLRRDPLEFFSEGIAR